MSQRDVKSGTDTNNSISMNQSSSVDVRMSQTQLREHFKRNKPLTLEEALK